MPARPAAPPAAGRPPETAGFGHWLDQARGGTKGADGGPPGVSGVSGSGGGSGGGKGTATGATPVPAGSAPASAAPVPGDGATRANGAEDDRDETGGAALGARGDDRTEAVPDPSDASSAADGAGPARRAIASATAGGAEWGGPPAAVEGGVATGGGAAALARAPGGAGTTDPAAAVKHPRAPRTGPTAVAADGTGDVARPLSMRSTSVNAGGAVDAGATTGADAPRVTARRGAGETDQALAGAAAAVIDPTVPYANPANPTNPTNPAYPASLAAEAHDGAGALGAARTAATAQAGSGPSTTDPAPGGKAAAIGDPTAARAEPASHAAEARDAAGDRAAAAATDAGAAPTVQADADAPVVAGGPRAASLGVPGLPGLPGAPGAAGAAAAPDGTARHAALSADTLPAPLHGPGFAPALAARVVVMLREGTREARLQLNPAELGPIGVRISVDGTQARVDLVADQAPTRSVLEQALPSLAGALRDSGLTLSGGGVFDAPRDGQRSAQDAPAGRHAAATSGADDGTGDPAAPGAIARRPAPRGVLDLYA